MSLTNDFGLISQFGPLGVPIVLGKEAAQATAAGIKAANKGESVGASILYGFGTTFANWALIAIGVIMALGALLISQKQRIVKVADVAAKGAALLG
ncbi:MAG: hypothetical protein U7M05_12110 [Candidatus Igneacidithiobacillus chanchocoensis]